MNPTSKHPAGMILESGTVNTKIKEPGWEEPRKQAVIGSRTRTSAGSETCAREAREAVEQRATSLSKKVFVFLSITWMNYVMFPYAASFSLMWCKKALYNYENIRRWAGGDASLTCSTSGRAAVPSCLAGVSEDCSATKAVAEGSWVLWDSFFPPQPHGLRRFWIFFLSDYLNLKSFSWLWAGYSLTL